MHDRGQQGGCLCGGVLVEEAVHQQLSEQNLIDTAYLACHSPLESDNAVLVKHILSGKHPTHIAHLVSKHGLASNLDLLLDPAHLLHQFHLLPVLGQFLPGLFVLVEEAK